MLEVLESSQQYEAMWMVNRLKIMSVVRLWYQRYWNIEFY